MKTSPIAIVGQGCVLPGALNPGQLWQVVLERRDLLGRAPEGYWRVRPEHVLAAPESWRPDKTWSDRGGYVHGFEEIFDPSGFAVEAEEILSLDVQFHWVLHAGREALRQVVGGEGPGRAGLVLGNLAYPTFAMAEYAEAVWREQAGAGSCRRPHPRNRFHAGSVAHLAAEALRLHAGAFALDAGCASSLYAIKLACDRLHDGSADLMLAGGVNRADDLLIHVGFSSLRALSRSGRSRPFHAEADGLVPAEGVALVALKRLEDAEACGDDILGVIRGVGLSNDGREGGLLSPSAAGQARAMRRAYRQAGLDPRSISLVECHATGTPVGDGVEVQSLAEVFAGAVDVPVGSLKSNFGHPITAAGAAGLLKVLAALKAGVRPPTRGDGTVRAEWSRAPIRVLHQAEPWECDGPRRAAVSAFGLGGTNAHLIVEEWPQKASSGRPAPVSRGQQGADAPRSPAVAVVGLAVEAGGCADTGAFADLLFGLRPAGSTATRIDEVVLDARAVCFPPRELHGALPQQLLVLKTALAATAGRRLPAETGVFVGMQCDAEVARSTARLRVPAWIEGDPGRDWVARVQDAFAGPIEATVVIGTTPNIPASRVSVQLDASGPGFTVSAEELSGIRALEIAARGLRAGEIDAAVVGAVDLCCEPVHAEAAAAVLPADRQTPGDAAVVLVLKRLADARRDGDRVYAVLDEAGEEPGLTLRLDEQSPGLTPLLGHAHAASGLLLVAAAVLALHRRLRPVLSGKQETCPWPADSRRAAVHVTALGGQSATVHLREDAEGSPQPEECLSPNSPAYPLRYPAHRPPVVLPPLPVKADVEFQPMAPAPALAPILDPSQTIAEVEEPAVARAGVAPEQGERRGVSPPVGQDRRAHAAPLAGKRLPSETPTPGPRLLHAALRRQRQVFEHYLRRQQEAQKRFLILRTDALRLLAPGSRRRRARTEEAPLLETPPPPLENVPFPPEADAPRGPSFDRKQLEVLAAGKISEVFGPLFEQQDGYRRQVRLPTPPLLLVDRVTGIDAEPGVPGQGTIWTETDVREDSWYLHHGVMPAGLMIEAGQADLTLISWMGADFENKGERVYRLLGCDLAYHGGLARPGDTLSYDIHIDGHARQGDVRLFFFHYDCRVAGRPRMTVRNGQAGFFTDRELADSGGVLWSAETGEHFSEARLDPPVVKSIRPAFDASQVAAYYQGLAADCFGQGYELLHTHTRTPLAGKASLQFFDEVTHCDARGGPWGRGYLRARKAIAPTAWFFDGHFKDDPCMPGTLMFEGAVQTMGFYLTALGFTLDKDGWRFEPVPEETYRMRCRGQVTPASRELVYELFVEEVHGGPEPVLYADVLCTVDGLKAFHCRRLALRLVPDWLLGSPLPKCAEARPFAVVGDVRGDYPALLACAWGRPSDAFGSMCRVFDGPRRTPRLPGPPYHFLSRIVRIEAEKQVPRIGAAVEAEYDVPADAWYFDGPDSAMPFCVLLEACLQPCGWLSIFLVFTLRTDEDLYIRNLDGDGAVAAAVTPEVGTLRTRSVLTKISEFGGLTIVTFETATFAGDRPVCRFTTSFGFFTRDSLAKQVGLPPTPAELAALEEPSDFHVDLAARPARYFDGPLKPADGQVRMIDRVTGYWPEGGRAGLGRLRAEQSVDPAAWYFKAHFFQDPVQGGSLGLEAMLQLLRFYLIERGLDEGIAHPVFEPMTVERPVAWKYRGQVVPTSGTVRIELEVVEVGRDERGPYAVADAWLWVDGLRIYHARGLGLRIVSAAPPAVEAPDGAEEEFVLDPEVDGWLGDHRPTFCAPTAPLTWMAEAMAQAALREYPAGKVLRLEALEVRRWLVCERAQRLRVEARPLLSTGPGERTFESVLSVWREASAQALSRFETVAVARVVVGDVYPEAGEDVAAPGGLEEIDLPYRSGAMPHGPAFRLMRALSRGPKGAAAVFDAAGGAVPVGLLHPALLDGIWQTVTRPNLRHWCPDFPAGAAAYPSRVERMEFFGPTPTDGPVHCEIHFERYEPKTSLIWLKVQMRQHGRVWLRARVAKRLFPLGPLGAVSEEERAAFVRDHLPVPGLALSRHEGGVTRLSSAAVKALDWLPGSVARVYGAAGDLEDLTRQVAIKEHVARRLGVHPAEVAVGADGATATCAARPGETWRLRVGAEGNEWVVSDRDSP